MFHVPDCVAKTFESFDTVTRGIPRPPAPVPVDRFVPPNCVMLFAHGAPPWFAVTVPVTCAAKVPVFVTENDAPVPGVTGNGLVAERTAPPTISPVSPAQFVPSFSAV